MFETLIVKFGMSIITGFLDKGLEAFKLYENKQISMEELKTRLHSAMVQAARDVEIAQAEALAKTYASFMDAMKNSKLMQQVWAFVTISQAVMLLWFQLGIPFIVAMGLVQHWPSSGDTAGWAFALVGACLGMGPLVLKTNNKGGSDNIADKLKQMVK